VSWYFIIIILGSEFKNFKLNTYTAAGPPSQLTIVLFRPSQFHMFIGFPHLAQMFPVLISVSTYTSQFSKLRLFMLCNIRANNRQILIPYLENIISVRLERELVVD